MQIENNAIAQLMAKIIEGEPYFVNRVKILVAKQPVTLYELAYLYSNRYQLNTSPLIDVDDRRNQAIIIAAIPELEVRLIEHDHPVLGKSLDYIVFKKK